PLVLASLLAAWPTAFYLAYLPERPEEADLETIGFLLGGQLVQMVLVLLVSGAVAHFIVGRLEDRRTSLRASFAAAWHRLLPMLGIVLCLGFAQLLCFTPLAFAVVLEQSGLTTFLIAAPTLVAAIWIFTGSFVALAVCVLERRGVVAALRRSFALTRGFRLRIAVASVLVQCVAGLAIVPIATAVAIAGDQSLAWLVGLAMVVLVTSLQAVLAAVVYQGLRAERQGIT